MPDDRRPDRDGDYEDADDLLDTADVMLEPYTRADRVDGKLVLTRVYPDGRTEFIKTVG